jgi:hypothetical protein
MLDLAGPPSTLQPHPAHPSLQIFTKKDKKDGHPPPPSFFLRWGDRKKGPFPVPQNPFRDHVIISLGSFVIFTHT